MPAVVSVGDAVNQAVLLGAGQGRDHWIGEQLFEVGGLVHNCWFLHAFGSVLPPNVGH